MEHANRLSGFARPASKSIAAALQAAVERYCPSGSGRLWPIEVELDPRLATTRCDLLACELLDELVYRTLACSPAHAELSFSAWLTPRGIEIELATSGSLPDSTPHSAFSRVDQQTSQWQKHESRPLGSRGYTLYCARCPQGGQAWTLVLPTRSAVARAA